MKHVICPPCTTKRGNVIGPSWNGRRNFTNKRFHAHVGECPNPWTSLDGSRQWRKRA